MIIPVRVDPQIRAHVVARGRAVAPDNPLADRPCPVCDEDLGEGPVSLVYVGRDDPDGWTAASVAVHDDCADGEDTDLRAELQRLRSHVRMLEGDKASMGRVYGDALITRQRYAELEKAARAFALAARNPKHQKFWRQPWGEMAAMIKAVDALPVEEGSDG